MTEAKAAEPAAEPTDAPADNQAPDAAANPVADASPQSSAEPAAEAAGQDKQQNQPTVKKTKAKKAGSQQRESQVLPRPDKQQIIGKFRRDEKDVGSSEVQISLISARISHLTSHLKEHPKDRHTERGLMLLVNKRRKLLDYLSASRPESYRSLISQLNLRR